MFAEKFGNTMFEEKLLTDVETIQYFLEFSPMLNSTLVLII